MRELVLTVKILFLRINARENLKILSRQTLNAQRRYIFVSTYFYYRYHIFLYIFTNIEHYVCAYKLLFTQERY